MNIVLIPGLMLAMLVSKVDSNMIYDAKAAADATIVKLITNDSFNTFIVVLNNGNMVDIHSTTPGYDYIIPNPSLRYHNVKDIYIFYELCIRRCAKK